MARLKTQMATAMRNLASQGSKDSLDKEIKRLDIAAQTPSERKKRRTRRFHMLQNKPS